MWKCLQSLADSGAKTSSSCRFLRPHFSFPFLDSKISRYMCKLHRKVRNGQNLPHESPNFTNYFFQSNFTYNWGNVSTSLRPHYQNSFFLNYFFFVFIFKLQNVKIHFFLASQRETVPSQTSDMGKKTVPVLAHPL